MQYLEFNIAKKVKAIPKGKSNVPYWTKQEFEKIVNQIYINDFYEQLNFVISPEITLKYYDHMWGGADTAIAEEMSGNINVKTAKQTQIKFNGNQSLKK